MSLKLIEFKEILDKTKHFETYEPSFLETIEKATDETTISKYLAFIFKNDIQFLNIVLEICYSEQFNELEKIDNICTEYTISDNKRIDILIEAEDSEHQKILIVIENKVFSQEHSNQCKHYYEYCENRFKTYKRYYLFLYPDFNVGIKMISDNHFVKLTYTTLSKALSLLTNKSLYEIDLARLIENCLRSKPMNELKTLIINNYDIIKENLKSVDKALDCFLDDFAEKFCTEHEKFLKEFKENHRTLRLYKDDLTRWNGWKVSNEDRIFFYIELKCEKDLNFYAQRTLKVYSKNPNTKINKFVNSLNKPLVIHDYMDTFKVFDRVQIKSKYQILSSEWKLEIFNQANNILNHLE